MSGCPMHAPGRATKAAQDVQPPRVFRLDDEETQRHPFGFYPGLRERCPVLETDLGGQPAYVLSRREDIAAVLMDPVTFSARTTPAPTLLHMDPPEHRERRAMVSDLLTRTAVEAMAPFIEHRCAELLDTFVAAGGGDVIDDLAGPLTVSVMARLMGISNDDVVELRRTTKLSAEAVRASRTGQTPSPEAARAGERLQELATRMAAPGNHAPDGLVARLAALAREGRLTEVELSGYVVLLMVAGHSTTTNLIGNAVYLLTQHPESLARLRDEPAHAAGFLEEVLRLRPSFQRILRVTTRDVEVAGTTIPARSTVYLLLGSGNRDPEGFTDPDAFTPDERRPMHQSFGQGVHTCLGQWLARLDAGIALSSLASRVESVAVDPDRAPEHLAGGTFNEFGFEHLHVRVVPRERDSTVSAVEHAPADEAPARTVREHTPTGGEHTLTPRRTEVETEAVVLAKTPSAEGVVALELAPADGGAFPHWAPGAHVDLMMTGVETRQYSLCGDLGDRTRWRLGILRDEHGRGSSRHVHDTLAVGDRVRVRGPRNTFPWRRRSAISSSRAASASRPSCR